jgi:hypothetical protein
MMKSTTHHTHLLPFPAPRTPAGGRLDALNLLPGANSRDLQMDYQEFEPTAPGRLFEHNGIPMEVVQGRLHPRRLLFTDVQFLDGEELCSTLNSLPEGHPNRDLTSALAWRAPEGQAYYLFSGNAAEYVPLLFTARACRLLPRQASSRAVEINRDWSPQPLEPVRMVPNPKSLHRRFGGDPVTIHMDGKAFHRRLFTGGVDIQPDLRPDVHAVLNLGEDESAWIAKTPAWPADRWENKGEGSGGMSIAEIAREAAWVIERLQAGQRVLVHCAAGMNRSGTICCATLILLEGLTAEAALARVREHHPWARPDTHHWLKLRWLAQRGKE